MCDQILLLFTASWSQNQFVIELFLSFLPKGVIRKKLLNLEETMKTCFANYFPDGILFHAVIVRDHPCKHEEVKFKMRTPSPILRKSVFKNIFKFIKKFSCSLQNNDVSAETGDIDPLRYDALKNQLKEGELEFISLQELHIFMDAIQNSESLDDMLREDDVVNYEEQFHTEEQLLPVQKLPGFSNENLSEDMMDGVPDEDGCVVKYNDQMNLRETELAIAPLIQKFLDEELNENIVNEILHEVDAINNWEIGVMNYDDKYVMNYQRKDSTNNDG